jgi:hypothetical protein
VQLQRAIASDDFNRKNIRSAISVSEGEATIIWGVSFAATKADSDDLQFGPEELVNGQEHAVVLRVQVERDGNSANE